MKNLTKSLLTLALITLGFAAPQAQAADAYSFHNIGFSADGRYFAFANSAIGDGTGWAMAQATIVDVAQNKVVKTATAQLENETSTEVQALKVAITKLGLRSFGINGKLKGNTLWVRLPTDQSKPVMSPEFSLYYSVNGGASSIWPMVQLNVKAVKAPGKGSEEDGCFWGDDRKMLDVSLKIGDISRDAKTITLQKDDHLPKSRGCVYAYEPREIIENNGSIVTVLRMTSPGWEGPDYNHMVVTHGSALKTSEQP